MTPTVSVVVPSYNSVGFIDATIQSILSQEGVDFELIVADHSSTDGTWEHLQAYRDDARVSLSRTPAGGGAERNFNVVSSKATGTYLKMVCGDDVLLPGALARQVKLLETTPGAVLTAARRDLIDARGAIVVHGWGLSGLRGRTVDGRQAVRICARKGRNVFGEPVCVTMRRDALVESGLWDFRNPYLVDEATYIRVLLLGGRFVADPEVGAQFRINSGQWSVELAASQADNVTAFHRTLRREHPEVLSTADMALGNVRARLMAVQRRITYRVLGRRMLSRAQQTTDQD